MKANTIIKIKDWFLDKTQDTARRYNTWIDVFSRDEETGMEISIDGYKSVRVQEVLKETEKAVQVVLSTGDVVGSIKGWRTWIPKSVIAQEVQMFEKIKQALDPMPDYYNYTKELIELEQRYRDLFGKEEFEDMRKRSYQSTMPYKSFIKADMERKLQEV